MKKLVLVFLAVVMALSISGCRFGGAADYTAQEISELIRGGLSEEMTHEDLFNKFDSWGFDKIDDIIVSTDMHSKVFDTIVTYTCNEVYIVVDLDIKIKAYSISGEGQKIVDRKSDKITVDGIRSIKVYWNIKSEMDKDVTTHPLYVELEIAIPTGTSRSDAISRVIGMGFRRNDDSFRLYTKDRYELTINYDVRGKVDNFGLVYRDDIYECIECT